MYRYLEHEADVGIEGREKSIDGAFQEGAKAMFNLMAEIKNVEPVSPVKIFCYAKDIGSLFVEFLNELLAQKDIHEMLFSKFEINIINSRGNLELLGKAYGEPMNKNKHELKVEVKAATYSGLKVEQKNGEFIVRCVLDL